MPKQSNEALTANAVTPPDAPRQFHPRPTVVIIAKGASGGVGGSLMAVLLASSYLALGLPVAVGCLDAQRRVERQLPGVDVLTVSPSLHGKSSVGDDAVSALVSELYEDCRRRIHERRHYIVDQAATRSSDTFQVALEAGLQDDLASLGARVVVVCVGTVTQDSLREVNGSLNEARRAFPGATLVFVENQRDRSIEDLLPTEPAYAEWETMRQNLHDVLHFRLPRIRSRSIGAMESAGLNPITLARLDVEELSRRTGLPRMIALIARGDVQAILGLVLRELGPILVDSSLGA
jgi:hypothetical protein